MAAGSGLPLVRRRLALADAVPSAETRDATAWTRFSCILNGLDKGGAYALIALGLTLVFGTLGVVNFAHGALFMLGAFCAVTFQQLLTLSTKVKDPSVTFFDAVQGRALSEGLARRLRPDAHRLFGAAVDPPRRSR